MPGTCSLTKAIEWLTQAGRGGEQDALRTLVYDQSRSTRTAAADIKARFGVPVSHNVIQAHRSDSCATCVPVTVPATPKADVEGPPPSEVTYDEATGHPVKMSGVVLSGIPDSDVITEIERYNDMTTPAGYMWRRVKTSVYTGGWGRKYQGEDATTRIALKVEWALVKKADEVVASAFELTDEKMQSWTTALIANSTTQTRPRYAKALGPVGTRVITIADPQLGGRGTALAVAQWQGYFLDSLEHTQSLLDQGRPIEGIHIAMMGDEFNGVANNYANQLFEAELAQDKQEELALDLTVWSINKAFGLGLPVSFSAVASNHGDKTRNGKKDVDTSTYDNGSLQNGRLAKRVIKNGTRFGGPKVASWHFAEDTPGVVVRLSGEPIYFSHGHIERGGGASTELRTKSAIEKQLLGDRLDTGRLQDVRAFVMAHYHHYWLIEDKGAVIVGVPALEDNTNSKYLKDATGIWSPSGMWSATVGAGSRPMWDQHVAGGPVTRTDIVSLDDLLEKKEDAA